MDDVKDIRNKAEAMCAYARMAKDKQLEIDAAEIRARANSVDRRDDGGTAKERRRTAARNWVI